MSLKCTIRAILITLDIRLFNISMFLLSYFFLDFLLYLPIISIGKKLIGKGVMGMGKKKNTNERLKEKGVVYFVVSDKSTYLEFKKVIKSKGLTIGGFFNALIKNVVKGKIDPLKIIDS